MPSQATQVPGIRVVQALNAPQVRRVARRPQHSFNLKTQPHAIVPFMIAPVLPGETMQNLLLQSRVVSDPIKNPLIGWWKEYYFFYVKHRSLAAVDTLGLLQTMMLDPTTNMSSLKYTAANLPAFYQFKGSMDFVRMCHEAIVSEFFRDEDEANNAASIDGYYAAQFDQERWCQNLTAEGTGEDDTELPGVDQVEEHEIIPGFTSQYAEWEKMRDLGFTDATYEDFLRSYGVTVPKTEDEGATPDERHVPELIRFVREWTYPTNHVDPATGTPTSAVSWSIKERADKKRFFKEPGFLVGVTVTRPKIYLGNQKGAAVGLMDNAYKWLPAVLEGHPYISVIENAFSATDGILQNQSVDYWVDIRDLLLHGDQFLNHAADVAANHGLALPPATLDATKKYPTEAMVNSLFVTAGTDYIREDGLVSLNILSRLRESTP